MGSAALLAALLSHKLEVAGGSVGVVIGEGNATQALFADIDLDA